MTIATAHSFDSWEINAPDGTSLSTALNTLWTGPLIEDKPKWVTRSLKLRNDAGTRWTASVTANSEFELDHSCSPTVGVTTPLDIPTSVEPETTLRDEVLKDLRQHRNRITTQSCAVQTDASSVLASIDDAIVVVQAWPLNLPAPCLDVDDDGHVSIHVLKDDGFAIAALDFLGAGHVAAYSIVDGSSVVCDGKLKTTSTTEILQFFSKLSFVAA